MKKIVIDGHSMQTKLMMYDHLKQEFSFPPYFGNNLDALWDILNENDVPIQICFLHADAVCNYLGEYGEQLIRLFKKLAKTNRNYCIYFK